MKRFIWGIVLVVLGVFGLIGWTGHWMRSGFVWDRDWNTALAGILMTVGGAILLYYGRSYLQRRKRVGELALEMLRRDSNIDADNLARQLGVSEVDVRELLAELQRRNVVPSEADIV